MYIKETLAFYIQKIPKNLKLNQSKSMAKGVLSTPLTTVHCIVFLTISWLILGINLKKLLKFNKEMRTTQHDELEAN